MSTEVSCINGSNSEIHHQQQESLTDGMEDSVVLTTPSAVKSIVTEETDFLPETTGTNSHPIGTLCSASGPASGTRGQNQKNDKTRKLLV